MKFSKCLIVALVIFSSFPVLAQQADANVQQGASVNAAGSSANQSADVNANAQASASGSAAETADMRPVAGELVEKLDSKSAKVGDTVIVKTTEKASTSSGAVIPKGSRLVGHVTDVRAHSKDSQDSSLAVQFDRAELKGGQTMAIHSVIESIAPPVAAASIDSEDSLGGGMRSAGGGRSSGGLGGLGGGAVSGAGSLAGGAGGMAGGTTRSLGTTGSVADSGVASAGDGAIGAASHASGQVSAGAAGGLQTAAAGSGALAAHATAIPGLMLAGDATGATSGTLSASRKNVHLDGGTQMVLGVSAATTR